MTWLWVALALIAALAQIGRNLGQRALVRGPGALSRNVANAARYWVGLPVAALVLALLLANTDLRPHIGARVLVFGAVGGLFQIIATDLLIRLFERRAFGIGVAYQKSENLLMALAGPLGLAGLFGLAVAGDHISAWQWLGLVLATVGLIVQSVLSLDADRRTFDAPALLLGLGCGAAFMVTGLALTEAVRAAGLGFDSVMAALLGGAAVLTLTLAFQSLLMAAWIGWREPTAWQHLPARAGGLLTIGLCSVLGSFALYSAFGIAHPALVSTVKQIDIPLSVLAAYLLFGERPKALEWLGMSLIFGSVLLLILL